ncbi:MAG: transcription initiation factor TFIIIB, Brf1 subunit/Transcription initiation factor TFIIB [Halonotius sp. J07HN4]|nr:MAG: transcription initiation factor TFIIIB, Brf1 subunit/Transcription initiation factor TFIIB [Halonotius sp. J07HN4]
MYSAREQVENQPWLDQIEAAADELDIGQEARTTANDLFLSHLPSEERSKPAVAAASLYAGALIAGEERSQQAVADAMAVSRLSVHSRWKSLLESAGFQPPTW